jgi:hypothetical protein
MVAIYATPTSKGGRCRKIRKNKNRSIYINKIS